MVHHILKDALDSIEMRRVKILRCLTEERNTVDYYKLQKITHANLKTIKSDIAYINENFKHICVIKECESNRLELQIHNDDTRTLMLAFYYSTKSIPIIDFILRNECTMIKLSNELFIAQSSCYKYLISVKKFLKKYNLKLTRKNLKIIGEEIEIRKLMYLIEFVKNSKDTSCSLVDELIENIRFFGIKYSPALKVELTIILDIVIKRTMLKKNVQINDEIKKKIQEHYVYESLYKPLERFFLKKSINLPEDELDYLIVFLLSNINILVEENENEEIEKIKKNSSLIHEGVIELMESFEDALSISLKGNQKFFLTLLSFLKSRYINMRFIPNGYFFEDLNEKEDKPPLIFSHLQKKDLNIIQDIFYKWAEKYELKYIEPKDIEKCWILIESCRMQESHREYKVLLCISKGSEWEYYIETVLKKKFGNNIHIYLYGDTNKRYSVEREMDFIISDVKMNFKIDTNKLIIIGDLYNLSNSIEKIKILT